MNRPTVVRLQKIAARLASGKHFSARVLATELEVSKKTIDRDLAYMRDQLELPIETDGCCDHEFGGYFFSRPVQLCKCCGGKIQ